MGIIKEWLFHGLHFIGSFETLQPNWQILCDKLSIDFVPLEYSNGSNRNGDNWLDYYDEETITLTNEIYYEDFARLNYKML